MTRCITLVTMIPITSFQYKKINIQVLRLDLAHTEISGNKYYKLKNNITQAQMQGCNTILTFGGAFSNHIAATAVAGKKFNLNTIGIIRGEEDVNNPTLIEARENGMLLFFVGRDEYNLKENLSLIKKMEQQNGPLYIIPEGGTNQLAVEGCRQILSGFENAFSHIFCAVGTGGTLAGLISTPNLQAKLTGISVLKGEEKLSEKIKTLSLQNKSNWNINTDYHLGGYAKYNPTLIQFISDFESAYKIPLDPVYTSKVFFAVCDMIDKNQLQPEEKIAIIHTGGLQGWKGWNYRFN